MSELNDIELVINELKALIEDTVMTENEGSRRCLNSNDLNLMETWIELLKQANGVNSKPANCAIFDVSEALIAFFKWRKGQQLTADTVLEIETFAKEYESNL